MKNVGSVRKAFSVAYRAASYLCVAVGRGLCRSEVVAITPMTS